ncbi:MAG: HEAT repeat domain-containing protein [Candidatus Sabulitectum sp.]|nr:HEAT repeat domain-containing protein [Candidatus Sabulitectum sp.]
MIPFSSSEEERVRRQTAVSLGEFNEPALDILQTLLEDPSLAVRSAAWKSIDGIRGGE